MRPTRPQSGPRSGTRSGPRSGPRGAGAPRARRASRLAAIAAGLAATLASAALAPAAAQDSGFLEVFVNHAKVVKLAEPAATIIIGNDDIADATVKDATTLVVTGRRFGTTNLVILDVDGEPIVDERVVVRKDEGQSVRLFRSGGGGVAATELQCSPICALSNSPGMDGG